MKKEAVANYGVKELEHEFSDVTTGFLIGFGEAASVKQKRNRGGGGGSQ